MPVDPSKAEVEIVPAILPKSLKDLTSHLERLRGVSRKVQIDIYEGGFLGWGKTWPLRGDDLVKRVKNNESLPFWTEFDMEFDLMVSNPKGLALKLVNLNAARIVLHAAFKGAEDAAEALANFDDSDHPFPVGLGVALTVNDPLEILQPFEHVMDFVQVMGIAKVGAQGRPFDERSLTLLSRLRHRYPTMAIQVDGGAAPHVRELARAGASRIIVGSAIVHAKNPAEVYKQLYTKANEV